MSNGRDLLDPHAGSAVLWIRCKECGHRPVGVVQEGGRIPTAHDGEVLTGYLRSTRSGKARMQGRRATTINRGLLDPEKSAPTVVCPRHGNLALDQAAAYSAIVNNPQRRPANLHIGRDTPSK